MGKADVIGKRPGEVIKNAILQVTYVNITVAYYIAMVLQNKGKLAGMFFVFGDANIAVLAPYNYVVLKRQG